MIKIRQKQRKWRIEIENEEWEFDTKEEMLKILLEFISYKEKYGDLR